MFMMFNDNSSTNHASFSSSILEYSKATFLSWGCKDVSQDVYSFPRLG